MLPARYDDDDDDLLFTYGLPCSEVGIHIHPTSHRIRFDIVAFYDGELRTNRNSGAAMIKKKCFIAPPLDIPLQLTVCECAGTCFACLTSGLTDSSNHFINGQSSSPDPKILVS